MRSGNHSRYLWDLNRSGPRIFETITTVVDDAGNLNFGPGGQALWDSVDGAFDLEAHEVAVLTEACRVRDRLDEFALILRRDGLILGTRRPHPALTEARQQGLLFTRLIASLRLPEDMTKPEERPQHRGASRGIYAPTAGERMRELR